MNLVVVRHALLLCTIINYVVLLIWVFLYMLPHHWIHRVWARWFHLRAEHFDAINFAAMALYKLGILLFNLVPYIALRILA